VANATARVAKGVVRRQDEFIKRSSATLAAETRFYQHAMIGTKADGYLAKFDDTAVMRFAGLVRGDQGNPLLPAGTAGDGTIDLDLQQPFRFELAVAGVAVTDIGRKVYASDDQTGSLTPGTYGNVVGVIVDVPASGIALVEAEYAPAFGEDIQVASADGAIQIRPGTVFITKGSAAALTIANPTSGVHDGMRITIVSTTAFAHTVSNAAGAGFNGGGAASDVGTFAAAAGNGMTLEAYQGKWYVSNNTGVTLA
jgi:hypothetical protein